MGGKLWHERGNLHRDQTHENQVTLSIGNQVGIMNDECVTLTVGTVPIGHGHFMPFVVGPFRCCTKRMTNGPHQSR